MSLGIDCVTNISPFFLPASRYMEHFFLCFLNVFSHFSYYQGSPLDPFLLIKLIWQFICPWHVCIDSKKVCYFGQQIFLRFLTEPGNYYTFCSYGSIYNSHTHTFAQGCNVWSDAFLCAKQRFIEKGGLAPCIPCVTLLSDLALGR